MIGCVDCESEFLGKANWKNPKQNTPIVEKQEFWECIEYDEDFQDCIQTSPEEAMVIYLLKEKTEDVKNHAKEQEIPMVQAAEELVEGMVMGGKQREMVEKMGALVSAETWKTKKGYEKCH